MDDRYTPVEDYAQSSNSLFHFMSKELYLQQALQLRALMPRYCMEKIDYLELGNEVEKYTDALVLQKCFCDIPFHQLAESVPVQGTGELFASLNQSEKEEIEKRSTHFDLYGNYAISFSKAWGENKGLQPIQYLNPKSSYRKCFSNAFRDAWSAEDISEGIGQDILSRISFCKPLRGIMQRQYSRRDGSPVKVEIIKNFRDECEWRYVPPHDILTTCGFPGIVANPSVFQLANEMNERIEKDDCRHLWLNFDYDDIRYLVVPDGASRISLINTITDLPDSRFREDENASLQKSILISKILVLNEIRKDW